MSSPTDTRIEPAGTAAGVDLEKTVQQTIAEGEIPVIAHGKTKVIRQLPYHPTFGDLVLIESTDAIKTLEGKHMRLIPGKGKVSTGVTIRIFEYLAKKGVPSHYTSEPLDNFYFQDVVRRVNAAGITNIYFHTQFFAKFLAMQPFKFVVHRIATGSYLKRDPRTVEGERFDEPVVEVFLNDDSMHNPLVILDTANAKLLLYDPKKRAGDDNYLGSLILDRKQVAQTAKVIEEGKRIALQAFLILEEAFENYRYSLVHLKIEVGIETRPDGSTNILLGDVITPDEILLWPDGDRTRACDKQWLLDTPDKELTPEMSASILKDYKLVESIMRHICREPDHT